MNEKFCYSAISSHKLLSIGLTLSESVPYGQNSKELCDLLGSIRVVDCESQNEPVLRKVSITNCMHSGTSTLKPYLIEMSNVSVEYYVMSRVMFYTQLYCASHVGV